MPSRCRAVKNGTTMEPGDKAGDWWCGAGVTDRWQHQNGRPQFWPRGTPRPGATATLAVARGSNSTGRALGDLEDIPQEQLISTGTGRGFGKDARDVTESAEDVQNVICEYTTCTSTKCWLFSKNSRQIRRNDKKSFMFAPTNKLLFLRNWLP